MVSRDLSSDALTSDWEAWLLLLLLRGTSLRFFKTEQTVTTLIPSLTGGRGMFSVVPPGSNIVRGHCRQ